MGCVRAWTLWAWPQAAWGPWPLGPVSRPWREPLRWQAALRYVSAWRAMTVSRSCSSPFVLAFRFAREARFYQRTRSQSSAASKRAREGKMRDGITRFAHHEERLRLTAIALHLPGKRFTIGVGGVIAQMRDQLDVDLLAIEITLKIEEIDFEHRLTSSEGRARSDISRALIAASLVLDSHRVDSVGNFLAGRKRQIHGGKAETFASPSAALDFAAHAPPVA